MSLVGVTSAALSGLLVPSILLISSRLQGVENGLAGLLEELRAGTVKPTGEMRAMKGGLKAGFGELREELRAVKKEIKEEMRAGFGELKAEIRLIHQELAAAQRETRQRQDAVAAELRREQLAAGRELRGFLASYRFGADGPTPGAAPSS